MSSDNSFKFPINYLHYPSDINDHNISNHTISLSLFALNDIWILSIFILCLCGLLCTIILSLIFIYLSFRRFNGHFLLTNLFICFSIGFIYIIILILLIRPNEIFCGLREFLSQLSYALLYSSLLCRYIMQWLGSRILSKRTKQLTSLLIYLLLIFVQIPIGILWWYFTIPRICKQRRINIFSSKLKLPKFFFHFSKSNLSSSILKSCSNGCIVDYNFYATFTYIIIELIFCTIISTCLFLCRHCHRNKIENNQDKLISINGNNRLINFLNMFAFILIDFIWLLFTLIYYFTNPFFIYPSLILSMFLISTICLIFILFPQIYYYSKIQINDIELMKTKTTLYSNKLTINNDINDQELLLDEKLHIKKSNESDISYELGESGTYLPLTRSPKGQFKITKNEKITTPSEKLDQLIYGEKYKINEKNSHTTDIIVNSSSHDIKNQQEQNLQVPIAPLQRQSTSSSVASDFVTPVSYRNHHSDVQYYTAYPPPRRDETIIPILCTSDRPRTSTPVQMRILVNSPSSSVPTTRRIHSGNDQQYIRHPYHRIYPPYYSPQPQQYLYVDPYRTVPSRIGGNTWHSVLLQPDSTTQRYPYSSSHRFHTDHRSLSQRLWDIDSGDDDDEDEVEEDIIKVAGRDTPTNDNFNLENNILLHIDDDEEEEENHEHNSYKKQYAHV